jgi:hypothetical protein
MANGRVLEEEIDKVRGMRIKARKVMRKYAAILPS